MNVSPQMAVKKSRERTQLYRSVDYSGFFERFFAWCVDLVIAGAFGYFMYKHMGLLWASILMVVFDLVVRITTTFFLGATPGKFLFGLRVVSRSSDKLSIFQVLIREFFKVISGIFLNLGYITIAANRRKKAWHDMVACTAVTSGGRDEARFAREIYAENPEKHNFIISGVVTGILVLGFLAAVNMGAKYLLYNDGMLGFTKTADFPDAEFTYRLPSEQSWAAGMEKNLLQLGDIDGDGGYEIFREGIDNGSIFIRNVRLFGMNPVDGDIMLAVDKPVAQYRLIDINGDKKDELAVLFEDKSLKIYKMGVTPEEIGSMEPLDYSEITSIIKGRQDEDIPYSLYIMGDSSKLTMISMIEGKLDSRKFDLEGASGITNLCIGVFSGERYLVGATSDNTIVFYSYDGSGYKLAETIASPITGKISMAVKDMNSDKKDEIILWSSDNSERPYPVMAAYTLKEGKLEIIWDGGRFYKYKDNDIALSIEDSVDSDKDGNLEMYMVSKEVSGQEGTYSIFIFEGEKLLQKANDYARLLSLTTVK